VVPEKGPLEKGAIDVSFHLKCWQLFSGVSVSYNLGILAVSKFDESSREEKGERQHFLGGINCDDR
jgi:hypothetical protein